MRESRKFCQRGGGATFPPFPQLRQRFFLGFFQFMSGRGEPLLAGHHRPASETPFRWHFAGVPMMAQHLTLAWLLFDFQGILTSIAKKPYIFVIYQRGSGPPVPTPGSAHGPTSPVNIVLKHGHVWYPCKLCLWRI